MQDINHDMENLLRRAAEDYPLKRGDDRWDVIHSKLSGRHMKQANDKRGHKVYLPFLLTIFLFSFLVLKDGTQYKIAQQDITETLAPTNLSVNKLPVNNDAEKTSAKKNSFVGQSSHYIVTTKPDAIDLNEKNILPQDWNKNHISVVSEIKPGISNNIPIPMNGSVTTTSISPTNEKIEGTKIITGEENKIETTSVPLNKKKSQSRFYYGIVAAGHTNAVKNQGFKKMGYDAGILIGYRFQAPISIETGLLFSKKYYWTPGKYFSMKEMSASMPAGMEMIEVHGSNKLMEIPLHIRYDMVANRKHHIYGSAGISSYLMTGEHNQYHTSMNGTRQEMEGIYTKRRRYIASTIDIGAGYEMKMGMKNRLRFEPYVQLPVRGIGIGDVPLKSAGIRIGIMRDLQ